jgi:nucleotidyltransferase/DNA polymerase involved in DNA repair
MVITKNDLADILLGLELQDIYGIGRRMEQRLPHLFLTCPL